MRDATSDSMLVGSSSRWVVSPGRTSSARHAICSTNCEIITEEVRKEMAGEVTGRDGMRGSMKSKQGSHVLSFDC